MAKQRSAFEEEGGLRVFYTGGDVAVSGDGRQLACTCGEELALVPLRGRESVAQKLSLEGDTEPVTALCFLTPSLVAAASRSLVLRVLETSTGTLSLRLRPHALPIATLASSADGALLASAGVDTLVKVHDIRHSSTTHSLRGHSSVVLCVRFHPDPSLALLFSSSDDGEIRAWDLRSNSCLASLRSHFSAVPSLSFSEDGTRIASAGRDKIAHLWDSHSFLHLASIPTHEALEGISLLPPNCSIPCSEHDGRLATVGERGRLRIFDSSSQQCLYEQSDHEGAAPRASLTACQLFGEGDPTDGIMLATGDCRILLASSPLDGPPDHLSVDTELIGNTDEVLDLAWVPPRNSELAVATSTDIVRFFDGQTMACTGSLKGHTDAVLAIDLSAPKRLATSLAVTASKDGFVKLWSADERKEIASGDGHVDAVSAVCIAKREGRLAVSGSADCTLRVWDVDAALRGRDEMRPLVAKSVISAHDKDVNCLSIEPNDSLVCSASGDKTAKIWHLPQLSHKCTLSGHKRSVWSCVFSPSDKCIATGSADRTMRLWSLEGACLRLFEGHSASVLRIAFATFGTQLMTSGGDSLVKVWTVRTGECNTTLDKHSDKLWSIAVANNGEKIATGGSDASVLVWRDATEQHAKEAAAREEERTQKQQKLENAMVSREYANAVELALQLERPLSLLDVFKRLLRSEGEETAQEVLKGLDKETLGRCIDFAREWNTNSKSCEVAHRLLQCVFHTFSPSMLSTLPRCIDNVDAMLPYSQRCVQRLLPFISFPLIEVAMNMCNETYVAGTFLVLIDF